MVTWRSFYILIFNLRAHILLFLSYLNSKHPNIEFIGVHTKTIRLFFFRHALRNYVHLVILDEREHVIAELTISCFPEINFIFLGTDQ